MYVLLRTVVLFNESTAERTLYSKSAQFEEQGRASLLISFLLRLVTSSSALPGAPLPQRVVCRLGVLTPTNVGSDHIIFDGAVWILPVNASNLQGKQP